MAGKLINGTWMCEGDILASEDGHYHRPETDFRSWISSEPSAKFTPEIGRYHLYICYACPWAHRTLIMRSLKGLENAISVSAVNPIVQDDGWEFTDAEGVYPDLISGKKYLHEIYTLADPTYTGQVRSVCRYYGIKS